MELLECASGYLEAHPDASKCPVCEQPIEARQLASRIVERRAAGRQVDEARKALQTARAQASQRAAEVQSATRDLAQAGPPLLAAVMASSLPSITALGVDGAAFSMLRGTSTPGAEVGAGVQVRRLLGLLAPLKTTVTDVHSAAVKDRDRLNPARRFVGAVEEQGWKAQLLELTWIGKEQRPRLEPRILLEDRGLSYHAARRVTDHSFLYAHSPTSTGAA